jgi:hypothetical protein
MCKPGKKKSLFSNWKGLYIFIDYKNGKGFQKQNHGSRICILKDFKEQCNNMQEGIYNYNCL